MHLHLIRFTMSCLVDCRKGLKGGNTLEKRKTFSFRENQINFKNSWNLRLAFRSIQGFPAGCVKTMETRENSHTMGKRNLQRFTDYTSISLAGVCIVHCFIVPLLLVLAPVGALFVFEEVFHELLLTLVIPASLLAVLLGCSHHRDSTVFLLAALGLTFLLIGGFSAEESKETILTLAGSFIMIIAHVRNFRLSNKPACRH